MSAPNQPLHLNAAASANCHRHTALSARLFVIAEPIIILIQTDAPRGYSPHDLPPG